MHLNMNTDTKIGRAFYFFFFLHLLFLERLPASRIGILADETATKKLYEQLLSIKNSLLKNVGRVARFYNFHLKYTSKKLHKKI